MTFPDAFEALARLAEIAFVGRVILSLCPPGLPGRHGFRDLPATWAASHLLGGAALALESRLAELGALHPTRLALVAPWLLVAFARWITLPGAMVPRHEPLAEAPGALACILRVAAPLAVLLGAALPSSSAERADLPAAVAAAASAIALLACCSFALATSRRSPTIRALVVLVLAAVLAAALHSGEDRSILVALGTGAGACFASAWIRRGDRRAAALAVIAFASCGLFGVREALFGAAGLLALWIHTPDPSKRWILDRSLLALALGAAAGWTRYDPFVPGAEVLTPMTAAVLLVVALAIWRRKRLVDSRRDSAGPEERPRGTIDPTHAERDAVRDAVLLCLFPLAARGELSSAEHLPAALLAIAPMVLLELGLFLAPAEQPPGTIAASAGIARR